MNTTLISMIKVGYFEEVKYNIYDDVLNIRIKNNNIVIQLHNKKSSWATISTKTNNKQNTEIYTAIKSELIEIHESCSEFIEFHESKTNKNTYSFFAIGGKKNIENKEVKEIEEMYMRKLLRVITKKRIYT